MCVCRTSYDQIFIVWQQQGRNISTHYDKVEALKSKEIPHYQHIPTEREKHGRPSTYVSHLSFIVISICSLININWIKDTWQGKHKWIKCIIKII